MSPTQTTTYTLTARNANGTDSKEVTIRVERQVKPEISFAVVPQTIQQGGSATLRWSILNAESASIDPQPGVLQQASGQHSVTPATSTTYTLTARSQDGTVARATATLQVTASAVRTSQAIQVIHDHGGFSQTVSCRHVTEFCRLSGTSCATPWSGPPTAATTISRCR